MSRGGVPGVRRGRAGPCLAAALLSCTVACAPAETEPTYTTPGGARVWIFGRWVEPEHVDQAIAATMREFAGRWPQARAEWASRRVDATLLGLDSYELRGRLVGGHVDPYSGRIFTGARTLPLHESAFVHELVHYLDIATFGDTDHSHESWAGAVFEGIARVNAQLGRSEAADAGEPAPGSTGDAAASPVL